jgi:hypothetical protein
MSGIDYEKNQYAVGSVESPDHGIKSVVEQKGNNIGEAADIYGDVCHDPPHPHTSMLIPNHRSALLKSSVMSSEA